MNHALSIDRSPQAAPYRAVRFEAFRVVDIAPGKATKWRTYALGPVDAGCLDEAVTAALALQTFGHKEQLVIREEGERGVQLHLFAVRRKSVPRYVHRDHVSRPVHDLYLELISSIDGAALVGAMR